MPRFLIHIGPHKTGTTYLQYGFTRLSPTLLSRGIIYPEIWGSYEGHHSLASKIHRGDYEQLPEAFDALRRCPAEIVLLSSETFSYFNESDIRQLHELIGGEPVTVVFYCRRWSQLVPSGWHETVKHNSFRTLPEYALSCLKDPWASPIINFGTVLNNWRAAFGADALRLVSYDGVVAAGDDLLSHFCRAFLNWPDPPAQDTARVNVSADMTESEIVRALNAMEWTRARENKQWLYPRFVRTRSSLALDWLIQQMHYEAEALILDDAAPALARLHGELFHEYYPWLLPPHPDGALFTPRARPVAHIRTDYLMSNWVIETLRDLHAKLLAMPEI